MQNYPEGLAFSGRVMSASSECPEKVTVEQNGKDALLGGLGLS
jgi:hypothetical protein